MDGMASWMNHIFHNVWEWHAFREIKNYDIQRPRIGDCMYWYNTLVVVAIMCTAASRYHHVVSRSVGALVVVPCCPTDSFRWLYIWVQRKFFITLGAI